MRSPTRRPTMSALPPAANGTISRIGRSGYFAKASRGSSTRTGVNPRLAISLRREVDLEVLVKRSCNESFPFGTRRRRKSRAEFCLEHLAIIVLRQPNFEDIGLRPLEAGDVFKTVAI